MAAVAGWNFRLIDELKALIEYIYIYIYQSTEK